MAGKRFYKIMIRVAVAIAGISIWLLSGFMLAPGSNVYAQKYEVDANPIVLAQAIESFKKSQADTSLGADEFDSTVKEFSFEVSSGKTHTKFIFSMYVPDNVMMEYANIYLISINRTGYYTDWKTVNKDLDREENLKAKSEFEKEILDKLKFPYRNRGNSMLIFWK